MAFTHGTRIEFLSTPSARRATVYITESGTAATDFYPRPPRGGRRDAAPETGFDLYISIYALREEGDNKDGTMTIMASKFLSTPSARRATLPAVPAVQAGVISIHALREEGDHDYFTSALPSPQFLSTPSARRATAKTETKSLFSNKLYNILHEFRRALIYNGSKNYPNHAK